MTYAQIKPISGKINFVEEAFGIDVENPFFSWTLDASENEVMQIAYRIIVSNDEATAIGEIGDIWDTGKIVSDATSFIQYAGKPLESFKKYYWRVKCWDNHGYETPFSDIYSFETAFLKSDTWVGKWVVVDSLLRKELILEKKVKKARIYISGLGYFELRLNGRKVGKKVLTPLWTDYNKKVLYSTYDVTEDVKCGPNCIGVMVGNSRYIEEYGYDGTHQVIADVILTFEDGETVHFGTDTSWKTSIGPIISDDIYNGETYDARLEQNGWDSPGFDDSNWIYCNYSNSSLGRLVSDSLFPPIEIVDSMKPKSIIYRGDNKYVIDFGQNFTGWVKLNLNKVKRGNKVKIRYSELINEDFTLNTGPNRTAKNEDIYISKGETNEIYEPRFTYHGFRYAEISGEDILLNEDSIQGQVVHSKVSPVGRVLFGTENDLLNKIHKMVIWSQVSNLMGIPTDCPQRDERMGWLGDSSLIAEESIMNFDMYGFYKKWLDDIRDSQLNSGEISDVVPPFWPLYPADPGWGDEFISLLWDVYRYYGDKDILFEYYPSTKKWLDFLLEKTENGILTFYKYGDWCPPKMIRPLDTPGELYATSVLFKDLEIMAKISRIIGNDDHLNFERELKNIKNSFNQKFLVEREENFPSFLNKQRYGIPEHFKISYYGNQDYGSQTSQVLPLYLGITPPEERQKVFSYLLRDVQINCSYHLNTGIFGTRYLLQVLSNYGHPETAYKIVTQTSYPGWGYMIEEGATTLWERWELLTGGPTQELEKNMAETGMNSHNHIMFGTVDNWFFDTVIGIEPYEESPGFKKFRVSPHVLKDITNIEFSFNSPQGIISYRLQTISEVKRKIKLQVPANTTCIFELDNREVEEVISINGKNGKKPAKDSKIVYELGSGGYDIKVLMRVLK